MKSECNLFQLQKLAESFASAAQKQDIFALSGDLGSGKTTFARYFINYFTKSDVSSPTFNLVNLYDTENFTIWHFDLYRLKHLEEVYELGIEDAFNEGVTILEWPEIISNILPKNTIYINIRASDSSDKRLINCNQY